MAEKKYRAQILLEPEQHKALVKIARERDQSISHVMREIVAEYLVGSEEDEQLELELSLMERADKLRKQIEEREGVLDGNLINEVREERARELWERMGLDEEYPD